MVMAADSPGQQDFQPRQNAVYRNYLRLQLLANQQFRGSLGGKLLVHAGFDSEAAELALATTIAGGAFLGIEPDPQRLKAAIRNGSCDFMVNTLDEALRVLKNELRQEKPLSVGLIGQPAEIFPTMVERGVQPDVVANIASLKTLIDVTPHENLQAATEATALFIERGASVFDGLATREAVAGSRVSGGQAGNQTDKSAELDIIWTTANLQDMSSMDRAALAWLPPEDRLRRRWLEQASAFFYRQIPLERVFSVRPEELASLLEIFRSSGPLRAPAMVLWIGPDGKSQSITV